MKTYPIILRIGGLDKDTRKGFSEVRPRLKKNHVFSGLTSSKLYKNGRKEFDVWVDSRQKDRQIVNTFFHEMTHLLCKVLEFKFRNEEALCQWVGYLAMGQFADANPARFGRKVKGGL